MMKQKIHPDSPAGKVRDLLLSRGHDVSDVTIDELFGCLKSAGYVPASEVEQSVKSMLNSISNEIRNRADEYRARF